MIFFIFMTKLQRPPLDLWTKFLNELLPSNKNLNSTTFSPIFLNNFFQHCLLVNVIFLIIGTIKAARRRFLFAGVIQRSARNENQR